jgi:hypothetical protein
MEQIPRGAHRRKAYVDRLGRRYGEITKRNPSRQRKTASAAQATTAAPRRNKAWTISITVTAAAVAITVGIIVTGGGPPRSGDSLTVQVKFDVSQAIAALAKLGFYSPHAINSSNPNRGKRCAESASGKVQGFLIKHTCKEYASAIMTVRKDATTSHVVITLVRMPSKSLAKQYAHLAGRKGYGNPPGEPTALFNGNCYAAHQSGANVWTAQVQPTKDLGVERELLQAAAPSQLTSQYLRAHCTE